MDARSQMYLSDMRRLADEENFILIYPQGNRLKGGDTHWNTMVTSVGNKSDSDDIGFIDSMLDTIALTHNIDSSRVYATAIQMERVLRLHWRVIWEKRSRQLRLFQG